MAVLHKSSMYCVCPKYANEHFISMRYLKSYLFFGSKISQYFGVNREELEIKILKNFEI